MNEPPRLVQLASPDGRLTAFIAPEQGGELCGLEWREEEARHELLWRGRDFSPTTGWTGRAPILWPAIGRTYAPGPEPTAETFRTAPLGWTVDDRAYPMAMHGFARSMPWAIEDLGPSSLRLSLADTPHSRVMYPFGFRLTVDVAVSDDAVVLRHTIRAAEDNRRAMPFALGNHATFKTPLSTRAALEDTVVTTNARSRMALDEAGRPTGASSAAFPFTGATPVTAIARHEVIALEVEGRDGWASLGAPGLSVVVRQRVIAAGSACPAYMTLWGDPAGGFLSLEAWLGQPNALASGNGLSLLEPGEELVWVLDFRVLST